ncbi:MAG TPA: L,D-transpeptidase [Polyangiaceae bacterium]|nr:L,D-transpeptidase [Polyangiaceae bacterium]
MRSRASLRVALSVASPLFAAGALAQGLPPWAPEGRPPLPEDVVSVEITRPDEPIFRTPDVHGPRRGAAALGARLPLLGVKPGPGCKRDWFLVGPEAWLCGDGGAPSGAAPTSADAEPPPSESGMPRAYYFVGKDGTLGYGDLHDADRAPPKGELQAGFAVSMKRVERGETGESYGLTTKGLWLPLRDLAPVVPLRFSGYRAEAGTLDRGFVVEDGATAYAEPGKKAKRDVRAPARFETVPVLETREEKSRSYVRIADGLWLEATSLRIPKPSTPPDEAKGGERWIDVSLADETLVAYEGSRPVFATLVSTGIGKGQAETATPLGVHRIWVKLKTTDMTNLEDPEAAHYYAMEEVPWVMFFEKGFGIHGAFWHRSFGHPRSHGCVNLTPRDARFLFDWAGPHLPTGWSAVLPTEWDPGTLVRVR